MGATSDSYEISLLSRSGLQIARLVSNEVLSRSEQPQEKGSALRNALLGISQARPPEELRIEEIVNIQGVASYSWSFDGSQLATWPNAGETDVLSLWNAENWSKVALTIKAAGPIRFILWSNTSKFIMIYSAYKSDKHKNVEIFHSLTGQLTVHENAKTLSDGTLAYQFGANDAFLCRVVPSGLSFWDLRTLELPTHSSNVRDEPLMKSISIKHEEPSIITFQTAPERKDGALMLTYFAKGVKGSPSILKVVSVNLAAKTISSIVHKAIYQVQEAQFLWSCAGDYVLARTHVDVDEKGENYYGKSSLFLLPTLPGGTACTVIAQDEGPIHDFKWSNREPREFCVVYGKMPCSLRIFNGETGAPVLSLGDERRNTLVYAPNGKHLCIAGFGNLPGDMDIWDLKKKKIVGLAKVPWVVECEFSHDSYLMLCSTTTPRLRVDNGVRILRANGDLILTHEVNELYRAQWRPHTGFSERPLTPGRGFTIPSSNTYKCMGAQAPLVPGRLLTATALGSQAAKMKQTDATLPPGLAPREKRKKPKGKVSEDQPDDWRVGAVVETSAAFDFCVEEVVTTVPNVANDSKSPLSDAGAYETLRSSIRDLTDSELLKRQAKAVKLEAEIRQVVVRKKLDAQQKKKVERLPLVLLELKLIEETMGKRSMGLDPVVCKDERV